jgi:hypothetical protein
MLLKPSMQAPQGLPGFHPLNPPPALWNSLCLTLVYSTGPVPPIRREPAGEMSLLLRSCLSRLMRSLIH